MDADDNRKVLRVGSLLTVDPRSSVFSDERAGQDGPHGRLTDGDQVMFLGRTRYAKFKAWEVLVLTPFGPGWMWANDTFCDGDRVGANSAWLKMFHNGEPVVLADVFANSRDDKDVPGSGQP